MRNLLRFLAVSSMVAALTVSGFSKPGNGNGGGHNPGGPGNGNGNGPGGGSVTSGTYTIGSIICSDSRILDLTGDYVLSNTLASIAFSIVQDDRGRLVTSSTVSSSGTAASSLMLHGHLQLTGHSNLRVQLNGGDDDDSDEGDDDSDSDDRSGTKDGDDDDDSDDDGSDDDDDSTSGLSVHLRGYWDGTTFQTEVRINGENGGETITGTLTPVNAVRGFSIAVSGARGNGNGNSNGNSNGKGKAKLRSTGTVTLPWGTETVRLQQQNKGTYTCIKGNSGDFGIDLRGSVDSSTTFTLSRGRVRVGYGNVEPEASTVTVLPAVQSAP